MLKLDFSGKKILIVGMGLSGVSCARFLIKNHADVTITDNSFGKQSASAAYEMEKRGVKLELGGHNRTSFENSDLVIVSPGVPLTIEPLKYAYNLNIPVTGEIEFASQYIKEPVVAVTGTNGKTTTTTLIGKMLENSGLKVFVCGNIGNPLADYLMSEERVDILVVEISSFQLDTIRDFRPKVSVLLNISEDHLDRYGSMKEYIASKGRIFMNQKENDFAVINGKDSAVKLLIPDICAEKLCFDAGHSGENRAVIQKSSVDIYNSNRVLNIPDIKLMGKHNRLNIAAAALAALSVNGTEKGILKTIEDFRGLSHRIEYVDTINGVKYYNDSKATNVDAVEKAIKSFTSPIILIMGGRDKQGDFEKLKPLIKSCVKLLLLTGEAVEVIIKAVKGTAPIEKCQTLKGAVFTAYEKSNAGDCVLLSPACSSFDMFESYMDRGNAFIRAVKALKSREK